MRISVSARARARVHVYAFCEANNTLLYARYSDDLMIIRAVSDSPGLFSEALCETDSVWRFVKYVRFLGENARRTTAYYNHFWQCTVNVGVHFRIRPSPNRRRRWPSATRRVAPPRIIEDDLPRCTADNNGQCVCLRVMQSNGFYKIISRSQSHDT